MSILLKSTVYLLETIPTSKNKKCGKYLATITDGFDFLTTNDLKLAKKYNKHESAENEASFWTRCGHKVKVVEKTIPINDDEATQMAKTEREVLEEKHRNSTLYDPQNIVVINALVKCYVGLSPFKESGQDFLCPCCSAYIPFDGLNDTPENAPTFCRRCGQRFDWSEYFKTETY